MTGELMESVHALRTKLEEKIADEIVSYIRRSGITVTETFENSLRRDLRIEIKVVM